MSERLRNVITVGLLVAMATTLIVLVATNPTEADRVESIGERIKCPVCQGESIAASPAQMARDMMALVAERVSEGQSDDAIVDELLSSFSGAVLLDPPARGSTLVLWLAPLAALGLGVGVIVWWRRHPAAASSDSTTLVERSRARRLAPLLILAGALATIVVVAGFFLQDRAGPNSGVANVAAQDLDDVSNETMEAVIEANAEDPQVDGMRFALAERYYEEGDFSAAFPHYFAIVESSTATGPEKATALIRLGWMAWQGNGEADTAISLFDQALALDSRSNTARYLKAQVLWCGTDEPDRAADLLSDLLTDSNLAEESRTSIESDLEMINSGQGCA